MRAPGSLLIQNARATAPATQSTSRPTTNFSPSAVFKSKKANRAKQSYEVL